MVIHMKGFFFYFWRVHVPLCYQLCATVVFQTTENFSHNIKGLRWDIYLGFAAVFLGS